MAKKRAHAEVDNVQAAAPATSVPDAPSVLFATPDTYLLAVKSEENLHKINAAGTEIMSKGDIALCPGIDCCAVCLSVVNDPISCDGCSKVLYCSSEHQVEDQEVHGKSCALLYCIAQAEKSGVAAKAYDALDDFPLDNSQVLEGCEGWSDVAPSAYHHLFGGIRRSKRQKQSSEVVHIDTAEAASGSADADLAPAASKLVVTPPVKATPSKTKAAKVAAVPAEPAKPPAAVPVFADGALFAHCTDALSYPYTVLHSLLTVDSLKAVVAAKNATPGTPLVLCVLGAACGADLIKLSTWKVLDGLATAGIILHFVGPDVPALLNKSVQTLPDTDGKFKVCFWQREFDAADLPNDIAAAAEAGSGTVPELAACPDAYFSFNAGLTSPDYEWIPTIESIQKEFRGRAAANSDALQPVRLPWLVTSSTLSEARMEADLLLRNGWRSVGDGIQDNPWKSLLLMQSSTLANEVYRKNAWVACYETLHAPQKPPLHRRLSSWLKTTLMASPLGKLSNSKPTGHSTGNGSS